MNEEIVFNMGLKTDGFTLGARRVKNTMDDLKQSAKDFSNSVKEMFSLKSIGELFAADKLREGAMKVAEFGEQIERTAKIAGVSTDFLQSFWAAARGTGGDTEKAGKGLEVLSELIGRAREGNLEAIATFENLGVSLSDVGGNAKGTEQVLREISDLTKNASDDNAAAAISVDVFGKKLGLELVPALRGGSSAIDAFGKSASKLSEDDLKNISAFKHEMDDAGNTALVWGGKVVSAIANVAGALGTLSSGGLAALFSRDTDEIRAKGGGNESWEHKNRVAAQKSTEEHETKIKQSKEMIEAMRSQREAQIEANRGGANDQDRLLLAYQRLDDAENELNNSKAVGVEKVKQETEVFKRQKEVLDLKQKIQDEANKKQDEANKKKQDDLEREKIKQYEINRAKEESAKAVDRLERAKVDRSRLSLEDLTTSNFRFGGQLGQDQQIAFRIKELERQGEWNRQHGFLGDSEQRFSAADELRKQLSENVIEKDRMPFKDLEESARETAEHLNEVVNKGKPINIVPANGK